MKTLLKIIASVSLMGSFAIAGQMDMPGMDMGGTQDNAVGVNSESQDNAMGTQDNIMKTQDNIGGMSDRILNTEDKILTTQQLQNGNVDNTEGTGSNSQNTNAGVLNNGLNKGF